MRLDQWLVLNIHGLILFVIIMAVAVALAISGVLMVHRSISHDRLKGHNDITGPIFNTLGTIYAVLLAFVMVIVWQKFDRVQMNLEMEMDCLIDLCADAEPFEPAFRQQIRDQIGAYAKVIVTEKDKLARGRVDPEARQALIKLIKLYSSYAPRNATESVFFQESVSEMNQLMNLRMTRVIEGHSGVRPLLWFVLVTGGVITIIFTMFFGSDSLRAKMLMSTLLAASIALVLFAILAFSTPYAGITSISNDLFRQLLPLLGQ